jgi:Holliday junction resolvasome RuvABC DNA-binding subunit
MDVYFVIVHELHILQADDLTLMALIYTILNKTCPSWIIYYFLQHDIHLLLKFKGVRCKLAEKIEQINKQNKKQKQKQNQHQKQKPTQSNAS